MYDLVVAEDENEILLESVEQGKGDVALVKAPMNGIELHISEEIVHPTHVPFESEPESAEVGGPGHTGPGG